MEAVASSMMRIFGWVAQEGAGEADELALA